MKNLFLLAFVALFVSSCTEAPKTSKEAGNVKAVTEEALVYKLDPAMSSVVWRGAKITETVHFGKVSLTEGNLSVVNGVLDAGSFTIDMNSIVAEDLTEDKGKLKLEGHLKSPDFFAAESFPTANFAITSVQPLQAGSDANYTINGNLTIKDVTKGITFPATVSLSESGISAKAAFAINRNEWGVVWGGSLTEQSIKDRLQNNLIKDEIEFEVMLQATK